MEKLSLKTKDTEIFRQQRGGESTDEVGEWDQMTTDHSAIR